MSDSLRTQRTEWIKQCAKEIGFYSVGIVPASSLFEKDPHLEKWNSKGYAGTMSYMEVFHERQERFQSTFPDAKSVILLTVSYYQKDKPTPPSSERVGRIARYAWGKDYHKVLQKKLKHFAERIREKAGEATFRYFVDTGPILERKLSRLAGLGFVGKNTTLITPRGSYFFLAELITDLELHYDEEKAFDGCGTCQLCIEACPTDALREPFVMDARRCISYLTIEHRGEIDPSLKPKIGDWLFGCDICTDVCPFNGNPVESPWEELREKGVGSLLPLQPILDLKETETFQKRFQGTPLMRPKREGLQRNASIVLENLTKEKIENVRG